MQSKLRYFRLIKKDKAKKSCYQWLNLFFRLFPHFLHHLHGEPLRSKDLRLKLLFLKSITNNGEISFKMCNGIPYNQR
jgi:hypothetical protein